MSLIRLLVASLLCAIIAAKKYDGVTLRMMTLSYTADHFEAMAPRFFNETGAVVEFTKPEKFKELLEHIAAEGETGIGHDMYLFTSTVMPEMADRGYLKDITDRVEDDIQLDWFDIVPFIRSNNVGYNNRVYALPFDGDALVLVSRSDLMPEPPRTIEELVDTAIELNGKDLNGDGIPDSGWCDCWGPSNDSTVYYIMGDMLMNFVTPYLQSKGSAEGVFFDPDNMDAMSKTSAWKKAFSLLIKLYKEGSDPVRNMCDGRDDMNDYGHAGDMFQNGSCAFYSFWSSSAMIKAHNSQSYAYTRMTHSVFPGSTEVNENGVLSECTSLSCPHAVKETVDGKLINEAPFAAYGGFVGAIASHTSQADASYEFLSFCNRPENAAEIVVQDDGIEPWRTSQLLPQLWEKSLPDWLVKSFLSTTREILSSKNVVIDLRIPGADEFISEAGKVVDLAMRDEITLDEAPMKIQELYSAIIAKKGGVETLLPLYRKSLNLPPRANVTVNSGIEDWLIAVIAVGGFLLVVVAALAIVKARYSQNMYLKQFNNNVVAERCASAIASMELDKVNYLHELHRPNEIQSAFIKIIARLKEYKAYMPQALFAEDDTIDEDATSHDSAKSGNKSTKDSTASQSQSSAVQKLTQQLRMTASKKKISVVHAAIDVESGRDLSEATHCFNVLLDSVNQVTVNGGGAVLYIAGDFVALGYNAASQCATHPLRACLGVITLRDLVSRSITGHDGMIGLAVATGNSYVGNCGTKQVKAFITSGTPLTRSRKMAQDSMAFPKLVVLIDNLVQETVTGHVNSEPIMVYPDAVKIRGRQNIISVLFSTNTGTGDEWMYEIQNHTTDEVTTDAFISLDDHVNCQEAVRSIRKRFLDKPDHRENFTHAANLLETRFNRGYMLSMDD
eukprot:TRINITY_DN20888_c0_g1_i1.p1 TRINITY_DN20888_c0_g1~~TRINITY_DN20888_c0_g1_i1.p1  ORF type:complete len:899 (+),score=154.65 TRINITY_DN20888_c0_g1_i1:91-2787(+)